MSVAGALPDLSGLSTPRKVHMSANALPCSSGALHQKQDAASRRDRTTRVILALGPSNADLKQSWN